jgi:protein SCO1
MMYAALSNHETAKPRNHEKEFGLLFRVFGFRVFVACVVAFLGCSPAAAQMTGAPTAGYKREVGMTASTTPAPLREIGFDQYIGETIPLDIVFNDESGRRLMLGDYFGKRPVVLVFAYYDCPMLCTQVINGLSTALNVLSLEPHADFEIVTVSFNPADTPATATAKKAVYLERYQQPGAGAAWHFLTGDELSIQRLTKAAGFRYAWDEDTKQFAHPSGIIVLTPDGRLARYLFGIEYGPRDLRFGIVEASDGKVGNPADALLLYCFHYDPMTGRYGLVVMRALRIAGIATVLALGTFIVVMVRREAFDSSADRAARLRQGYGGSAVAGADKAARAEAQGPARSE